VNIRKAWARSQEVVVEQRAYRTFSREDYLLYLCYHPVKHGYRDLRAVCDIAALLRSGQFDWDYVRQETEKGGCRRMLWLGVGLAHTLLGAPLPATMPECPKIERLMCDARAGLFGAHRAFRDSPTMWGMRVLDAPSRKMFFMLHKVFAPNEEEFALVSLPQPLFFGYYALRLVRLPWRYARIVKNSIARRPLSGVKSSSTDR
jgi:hypothetical protein